MYATSRRLDYICARCLDRAARRRNGLLRQKRIAIRHFATRPQAEADTTKAPENAMSRRLEELTEQSLEQGGSAARKAVEDAGFDTELKERLLKRIADASFRNEHPQAFAQVTMPSSAGQGTRDIAAAKAWTGTESVEDAALRMLDDSHKRLRGPKIGPPTRIPKKIDTGRPGAGQSSGVRLANARDKSSMYSYLRDESLSAKERDDMRKELKDRFTPGARPMPATLSGLTSLANQRIEDAIARGQFKNLPRGQKIERDYNMSSPFLNTTEYFMNKIIKKQDIVPPWIEKQQEVVATASKFRSRIRNDWKRHAARLIASRGGPLEAQIQRAEKYARAEAIINPQATRKEVLNTTDSEGHVSQITLTEQLHVSQNDKSPVMDIEVEESFPENEVSNAEASQLLQDTVPEHKAQEATVFPFRDKDWEQTERAYHNAAIENLNSLTRSYNLMAPNLARKPYFILERELRACFADVAPQLAQEISQRALAPKAKVRVVQSQAGGVLHDLVGGTAHVYDEQKPQYGFRQFWKELFRKQDAA